MEELLRQLLEGQTRMDKRFDRMENRLDSIENRLDSMENRLDSMESRLDSMGNRLDSMESRLDSMESEITSTKEAVERLGYHQENTIMSMLGHIKKQVEVKESQIQVLNKRLFAVESKTEGVQ